MYTDPINIMHKIQQPTQEGLHKVLEGNFRSSKLKLKRTILDESITKEIIKTCIDLTVFLETKNN